MSDDERRHALAHEMGVPFVKLDPFAITVEALVLIPEPVAREHNAVAYNLGERGVEVALLDLNDLEHLDFLRSKHRVLPRLTTRESLVKGLIRYQQHLRDRYGRHLESAEADNVLDTLLRHALASQATDVHLQNDETGLLIRYRINGVLRNAMTLPAAAGRTTIQALRELADLPTGTLPKEARVRVELDGEPVSVRVATLPIAGGEKVTLHITRDKARRGYTLESLGLHGEPLECVHRMLLKRRGVISVVGLPQSGKSTLAYTMLDMLNAPEISVATVEQSVAHALPRVAQAEARPELGLGMATTLRATLKQDPDVVMIDAVEDEETAALAMAAGKRGALVIAVADTPSRLPHADMVIVAATIPKLCTKHTPEQTKLTRTEQDKLEAMGADFAKVLAALKEEGRVPKNQAWKDLLFTRPAGCSECTEGYQGIIGIQEVIEHTPQLNLIEDALFKAAQGLTSVEEVLRLG